jgi:hemolysin activation/secretion protein
MNVPFRDYVRHSKSTTLGLLLLSAVCAAQAQTDAGSILQQQRAAPPSLNQLPKLEPKAVEPAPLRDTGGQQVPISSIRFSGHQALATDEELQAQIKPLLRDRFSFGQMEQLADTVTRHLKNKGWILARAYLPEQDLSTGVLTIAVQSGRIDSPADGSGIEVVAKTELQVDPVRIQRTFAARVIQPGEGAVNAEDLERALLLVNDLPGVKAVTSLERGQVPGTTRLRIDAEQADPLSANVWADNYGNRYTGQERANASMQLNNPLRLGDQLGLMATKTQGVQLGSVTYSLPVGYSGLRTSIGASAMSYEIGKEQAKLGSKGQTRTTNIEASYPLLRGREFNLNIAAKAEQKDLRDETGGLVVKNKVVNNREVSLSGDRFDQRLGGGIINFRVAKTFGRLDLSREPTDLINDQSTAQANGSFEKWSYSFARLQKMTDALSFFISASGQVAQKNLDSSEKFILGGVSGVRAYPTGEGSGDQGWVSNVELRYDWSEMRSLGWGDVQLVGFYDTGRTQLARSPWIPVQPNASGLNSYSLSGAGLGLNVTKTGKYSVRMAWARTLGNNPGRSIPDAAAGYPDGHNSDGKTDTSRIWLSALINF